MTDDLKSWADWYVSCSGGNVPHEAQAAYDAIAEIASLQAEVERLLGEEKRLVGELTASCARAELQQREAERLRRNNVVLHDTIEKIFEEGVKQLARADTAWSDAIEAAASLQINGMDVISPVAKAYILGILR